MFQELSQAHNRAGLSLNSWWLSGAFASGSLKQFGFSLQSQAGFLMSNNTSWAKTELKIIFCVTETVFFLSTLYVNGTYVNGIYVCHSVEVIKLKCLIHQSFLHIHGLLYQFIQTESVLWNHMNPWSREAWKVGSAWIHHTHCSSNEWWITSAHTVYWIVKYQGTSFSVSL